MAVVASTGLRRSLLPHRAYSRSIDYLAASMAFEINNGILPVAGTACLREPPLGRGPGPANNALNETPGAGDRAAASDGGLQEVEAKALRAALIAARETGLP